MDLSTLQKIKGNKRSSKRRGRGYSSGKGGHTIGKGQKGQKSRGSGKVALGFEGGQVPLYKRLPQIGGFKNHRGRRILSVRLEKFNAFKEGSKVTPESLIKQKITKKLPRNGAKILVGGELKKKLTFSGFHYSAGAKKAIEKSGSKIEE